MLQAALCIRCDEHLEQGSSNLALIQWHISASDWSDCLSSDRQEKGGWKTSSSWPIKTLIWEFWMVPSVTLRVPPFPTKSYTRSGQMSELSKRSVMQCSPRVSKVPHCTDSVLPPGSSSQKLCRWDRKWRQTGRHRSGTVWCAPSLLHLHLRTKNKRPGWKESDLVHVWFFQNSSLHS